MNIVALAAGSGKTSRSLELAKDLILKGFNITYVSITNVSVEDARHRFTSQYAEILSEEQMAMFKISTVHSYCIELIRSSVHFKGVEIVTSTEYEALRPEMNVLLDNSSEATELFKSTILARVETFTSFNKHAREAVANGTANAIQEAASKINKRLVLPLDWVLHVCKAFKMKPPNNDAIMIDEYQDMDAQELYAIADIFDDRAWLFGDPNQVLYIFRVKNGVYKPVEGSALEKVQTYRFDQYSCDILTRLLTYKNSLLPQGSSPIVEMFSHKELSPEPSIELIHWEDTIDWSKVPKGRSSVDWRAYCQDRLLYSKMRDVIEKSSASFQIVCSGNGIASKYSELITKQFGDILTSWYIPVYSHPMYRNIRDCLRNKVGGINNSNALARAVHTTLTRLGYDASYESIRVRFEAIREGGIPKSGAKIPETQWLVTAIGKMGERFLDNKLKGSYKASNKSNFASAINVLQMLISKGLRAAMSGVQLQSDTPKRGRVTTIHTSKGTESDYVLLDIQGQFRGPMRAQDLLQNLNALYVGMSRHKQKLWITMDPSYIELSKDITKVRDFPRSIRQAFENYGSSRLYEAADITLDNIFGTSMVQVFYPDLIGYLITMSLQKEDPKTVVSRIFPG